VLQALPDEFRPKDIETKFHELFGSTSGSSVQQFVRACFIAGLIQQVELPAAAGYRGTKGYRKVEQG
jgi:hypothetical protein